MMRRRDVRGGDREKEKDREQPFFYIKRRTLP
jgi:hypothetical protein